MKSLVLFFFIIFFVPFVLKAQNVDSTQSHLDINAQIKIRSEYREGVFQPLPKNTQFAALTSQRSRLSFSYKYNHQITLKLSPQAVSLWGQDALTQGITIKNGISFFEAWAGIKLSSLAELQVGRQVISLDDERFFGALDWAQGGRAHDAITLNVYDENIELKTFVAYNQNYNTLYGNNINNVSGNAYSPVNAAPYKWMQTVWGKYNFNEHIHLSLLVNNLGFQNTIAANKPAPEYFLQTFGLNNFYHYKVYKIFVSGYYQTGVNASGKKTNGYMAAIGLDRKFGAKTTLGIGGDLLSGDDVGSKTSNITKVFIPYFGTNHKFYGNMDYFYAGNAHSNTGLMDAYLKASFNVNTNLNFTIVAHQFITPNKIYKGAEKMPADLGQECDLSFAFNMNKYTKLMGGYSCYLTSPSLDYIKKVTSAHVMQNWVWISLLVDPLIFSSK